MTSDVNGLEPEVGRHHFRAPDPSDVVERPAPVGGEGPEFPRPPRPWYRQVAGQWPLFVSLVVVAVGIGVAGASYWRRGSTIAGAGVLVAAVLRLVLPERIAGLLCCRSRAFDAVLTFALGAGIIALAWVVSPTRK